MDTSPTLERHDLFTTIGLNRGSANGYKGCHQAWFGELLPQQNQSKTILLSIDSEGGIPCTPPTRCPSSPEKSFQAGDLRNTFWRIRSNQEERPEESETDIP